MSLVGINRIMYEDYTDDFDLIDQKAIEHREMVDKWKAEQPDFIAVKMTNAEIVVACLISDRYDPGFGIVVSNKYLSLKEYKIINEELYRKVKNPKQFYNRFDPVIPWEDKL